MSEKMIAAIFAAALMIPLIPTFVAMTTKAREARRKRDLASEVKRLRDGMPQINATTPDEVCRSLLIVFNQDDEFALQRWEGEGGLCDPNN